MFSIKKIDYNNIDQIKSIWEDLERGEEMTYFQSFYWNSLFVPLIPTNKDVDCQYWIIYNDNRPVLIAPLWILKRNHKFINKKCIRIIGNWGYTDYINFIYKDFDAKVCRFLFKSLKKQYGTIPFYIHDIKDCSSLYKFIIKEFGSNVFEDPDMPCPVLMLQGDIDSYTSSLSKKTRQNIRTAKNRANKDSIVFDLIFDADTNYIDECNYIREKRNKNRLTESPDKPKTTLKRKLKNLIIKILNHNVIKFGSFLPLISDKNSRIILIKDAKKNNVVAFFNYGIDHIHNEIVVMCAGIDSEYYRYSPGLVLMYEFICHLIKTGKTKKVDFTRGDEAYKLQLGAICNTNKRIKFII